MVSCQAQADLLSSCHGRGLIKARSSASITATYLHTCIPAYRKQVDRVGGRPQFHGQGTSSAARSLFLLGLNAVARILVGESCQDSWIDPSRTSGGKGGGWSRRRWQRESHSSLAHTRARQTPVGWMVGRTKTDYRQHLPSRPSACCRLGHQQSLAIVDRTIRLPRRS